ncbi:MAG: zinc-dependent metalloprotease [Chitinophagaceae bacterium]|nr:zinc-dependent metalloprotease [Chitinophagaceae bacterium]
MKKIILLTAITFLSFISILKAQEPCGTHFLHQKQLATNPDYKSSYEKSERFTLEYLKQPKKKRQIITIPVVFHVVYKTTAQNTGLTDAILNTALTNLNNCFNKTNSNFSNVPAAFQTLAADCDFNFVLAKRTINGCYTIGIERVQSNAIYDMANFTSENVKLASLGGLNIWDATKYLNVWICDLQNSNNSPGTFTGGYAYYPTIPLYTGDGIVINFFQNSILTETFPHEVGHWLNLAHTFCEGNQAICTDCDNVADTPPQSASLIGSCPSFPHIECPTSVPNGVNVHNFMSYSNCKAMFTQGQKTRMLANFALGGARYSMLSSQGANNASYSYNGIDQSICSPGVIKMNWNTSCIGSSNGGTFYYRIPPNAWSSAPINSNPFQIFLSPNTYYQYFISNPVNPSATSGSFTTLGSTNILSDEPNNTKASAKNKLYPSSNYTNLISTTDIDWYKTTITSGTPMAAGISNIITGQFTMTVENSAGVLQGPITIYPNTAGNTDGSIVWEPLNNPPAGTYFFKIQKASGQPLQTCPYYLSLGGLFKINPGEPNNNIEEKFIHVFPNPSNGIINVESNYENSKFILYDKLGRKVKEIILVESTNVIDISSAAKGIYLWKLLNDNFETIENGKLIIE